MTATRQTGYFEDFAVGDVFEHRRGRTFSQAENARWSLATMNTAQAHWNSESMKTYLNGQFDRPLMNAAIVLSVGVGLTSQDMSENMFRELALDELRISIPCFPDDTVTAVSTVTQTAPSDDFAHSGQLDYGVVLTNQHGQEVCRFRRSVLVKRRSHWLQADLDFADNHWPPG